MHAPCGLVRQCCVAAHAASVVGGALLPVDFCLVCVGSGGYEDWECAFDLAGTNAATVWQMASMYPQGSVQLATVPQAVHD